MGFFMQFHLFAPLLAHRRKIFQSALDHIPERQITTYHYAKCVIVCDDVALFCVFAM